MGRGSKVESIAAYRAVPTKVDDFEKLNQQVDDFALGENHTLAVTSPRVNKATGKSKWVNRVDITSKQIINFTF